MKSRSVLVVTYDYPPSPSVGALRWRLMTKYLARLGYDVTVVTSDVFGVAEADEEGKVVRPRTLESSLLLRRLLRRSVSRARDVGSIGGDVRPSLVTKLLVPDGWIVSWAPFALQAARRLLRDREFDCVITSSPPESTHLVGLLLGSRRPAWVADFRDGWNFEPQRPPFPWSLQRIVDGRLERAVVRAADVVVGATPPIANDLTRRLGARARWVSNGWDPDTVPAAVDNPAGAVDGVVRLVYTGRLFGSWGRTPEPLFHALKTIRSEPGLPGLRLVHAGPLSSADRARIDESGVADIVEHVGVLDRARVLELQRSADVLVLITSRNSSEATAKIFEYLAAGRPILALADRNEAARIIRETGTGIAVPPDDVEAIASVLRRVALGDISSRDHPSGEMERYAYPHVAAEMADVIETAIAARHRHR